MGNKSKQKITCKYRVKTVVPIPNSIEAVHVILPVTFGIPTRLLYMKHPVYYSILVDSPNDLMYFHVSSPISIFNCF